MILTGTMAGLCLWGMARLGRSAQERPTPAPSAPSLTSELGQIKPAEPKDAIAAPSTAESAAAEPAYLVPAPAPSDASAKPSTVAPTEELASVSPPSREPFPTDDPEKDAEAFAEQNRKFAETQLKTLTDEATKLRARLRKIDAGIKRWQGLLEAMRGSEAKSSKRVPTARPNGAPSTDVKAGDPFDAPPPHPAPDGLQVPSLVLPGDAPATASPKPR